MKRIGQHPNDDLRRAVDHDALVERAPTGHGAGKALGHDGHTGSGRGILVSQEITTSRHPDSEQPEETRGHACAAQGARLVAHAHRDVGGVVALQGTEALDSRSPVAEGGVRCRAPLLGARAHLPEMHQPFGLRVRQGLDQGGIGRREDRRGCAQAEADRQNDRRRQGGPLREAAQRVAEVLEHCIHLGLRCSGVRCRVPGVGCAVSEEHPDP